MEKTINLKEFNKREFEKAIENEIDNELKKDKEFIENFDKEKESMRLGIIGRIINSVLSPILKYLEIGIYIKYKENRKDITLYKGKENNE